MWVLFAPMSLILLMSEWAGAADSRCCCHLLVNGDVVPKEVPSWCQAAKQELLQLVSDTMMCPELRM